MKSMGSYLCKMRTIKYPMPLNQIPKSRQWWEKGRKRVYTKLQRWETHLASASQRNERHFEDRRESRDTSKIDDNLPTPSTQSCNTRSSWWGPRGRAARRSWTAWRIALAYLSLQMSRRSVCARKRRMKRRKTKISRRRKISNSRMHWNMSSTRAQWQAAGKTVKKRSAPHSHASGECALRNL